MGDGSDSGKELSPAQQWAATEFAAIFLLILIACLLCLIVLSIGRWFYWDDEQQSSIFIWDGFTFFLTKAPAVKIGGTAVFALIGALVTASAKLWRSERAVRNVTRACIAGILLTIVLWVQLSQSDRVFGEVSALADEAFAFSPPETRIAQVSAAIDYLMGSLLVWWIVTVATVLGLRKAVTSGRFGWFQRFFPRLEGRK